MTSETDCCKIWIRFETKMKNGEFIKLRIQDLPSNRMDDFIKFNLDYLIKDEAFHKAAGIYKNAGAIDEYKNLIRDSYEMQLPQIAICCVDNDSKDPGEILAGSTVLLMSGKTTVDDVKNMVGMGWQFEEIKKLFRIFFALGPIYKQSMNVKYENFYEGRGIIVHPDYRGLGIASKIVKQRRLLIQEHKVPMTCAWMTSIGSQKAAERDGWKTIAEVTLEELDRLTGLEFERTVPTYKLMVATLDS